MLLHSHFGRLTLNNNKENMRIAPECGLGAVFCEEGLGMAAWNSFGPAQDAASVELRM